MSDFNNRIAAQRAMLQLINARRWHSEELFGLSSKAIERWVSTNKIDPSCDLVRMVYRSSEALYFLANKSQEQITEEYKLISENFSSLLKSVELEMNSRK
jgi:hypothetical protein